MKIGKILAASALAGGLGLFSGAAHAAPSYVGPTGYIFSPSALVETTPCVNAGYHFFDTSIGIPGADDFSFTAVNVGLFNHFEVGGSFFNNHNSNGVGTGIVNMKATIFSPKSPFQLGGGVIDVANESGAGAGAYVVGQVELGRWLPQSKLMPKKLTAGAGWSSGGFVIGEQIFVNGSFLLGPNIELMGEWFESSEFVTAGARFRLGKMVPGLCLDIAGIDMTRESRYIAAGISYTRCLCPPPSKKHHDASAEPAEKTVQAGWNGGLASALR